jgi:hypothetical protein
MDSYHYQRKWPGLKLEVYPVQSSMTDAPLMIHLKGRTDQIRPLLAKVRARWVGMQRAWVMPTDAADTLFKELDALEEGRDITARVVARYILAAGRIVYHGSNRIPVDEIPPVDGGTDYDIWGKGVYLAFDPDDAEKYGTVRPLILASQARLAPEKLWVEALSQAHAKKINMPKDRAWAREKLRSEGWDGLQNASYVLVWNKGLLKLT